MTAGAPSRITASRAWRVALWAACLVSVAVWFRLEPCGWDTDVYAAALRALHAGLDPYKAATDVQVAVHNAGGPVGNASPPWSYVYSPLTLPLLRGLLCLPLAAVAAVYWTLFFLAAIAQVWVGTRAAKWNEARALAFAAPISLFFPGLLANGTILSGNVAFLLYAAILLTMWRGHCKGRWGLFYVAVVLASCIKAPLLCMVLLAPLQSRRQWRATGIAAAAGAVLFAMQPLVWPTLFRNYLQAVDLQFQINHDFGCSPAGLFSQWLDMHGLPYSPTGLICYALYALPLFAVLLHLRQRYLDGLIDWQEWFPLLLTGVVLMNPRLMEYDVAPLALPLALIAWRGLREKLTMRSAAVTVTILFLLLNVGAVLSWNLRKWLDGALLTVLFAAGALRLSSLARQEVRMLQDTEVHVG